MSSPATKAAKQSPFHLNPELERLRRLEADSPLEFAALSREMKSKLSAYERARERYLLKRLRLKADGLGLPF